MFRPSKPSRGSRTSAASAVKKLKPKKCPKPPKVPVVKPPPPPPKRKAPPMPVQPPAKKAKSESAARAKSEAAAAKALARAEKIAAKAAAEAVVPEPTLDFIDFVQYKRNALLRAHEVRTELEAKLESTELKCKQHIEAGGDWLTVVKMRKVKLDLEDQLETLQESMLLRVFDQQLNAFLELYSRKVSDATLISMFESNVLRTWLPSMLEVINPDVCKCGAEFMESVNDAQLVCAVCHTTQEYLDASTSSLAYGDDVEWSSFSYKRMNHLSEWLNHFQARETTRVPANIIQQVRDALPADQEVSFRTVNRTVRALKIPKYYDHAMQIFCQISGSEPIRLNPQTEERIRLMFMRIQQPFIKHHPPGRKNFLSYPYVVFKMLQLLDSMDVLPYVSLLKGEVVLMQQEDTWKKICNDVGWRFIPIPKDETRAKTNENLVKSEKINTETQHGA